MPQCWHPQIIYFYSCSLFPFIHVLQLELLYLFSYIYTFRNVPFFISHSNTAQLQSGFTNSKDILWLLNWDFIPLPILANNAISLDQNFTCGYVARNDYTLFHTMIFCFRHDDKTGKNLSWLLPRSVFIILKMNFCHFKLLFHGKILLNRHINIHLFRLKVSLLEEQRKKLILKDY